MSSPTKILNAILRTDFQAFLEKAFNTLNPSTEFLDNWHFEKIFYEMETFFEGDEAVLVINLPPRSLKSITISIAYVAWRLSKDPSLSFMVVSHSQDLSIKHALDFRRIIEADWYLDAFPIMRKKLLKNTETEYITANNGGRFATSIKGAGTGRGADIMIFDDPNKADDAESEADRKAVINAYRNTFATRHNDPKNAKTIVIQQRVHDEDLSGYVLKHEDCRHIKIPAIAEEEEIFFLNKEKKVKRMAGVVLHRNRDSIDSLNKLKQKMGSSLFSAQYQQEPVPADGDIIKWGWFKFYKSPPARKPGDMIICSWDTAGTMKDYSDYSVCTVWLCHGNKYYLLGVIRERYEYPMLEKMVIQVAMQYSADLILVENANTGQTLYQNLAHKTSLNIKPINPKGDKLTRMTPCTAIIEAERVILPEDAAWMPEYRRELLQFPNSKFDDQADSTSQFLLWARERDFGPSQLHGSVSIITSGGGISDFKF